MKLKIKKLDPNACISKTHSNDFCYDLVATSVEEKYPGVYMYGLGVAMELVEEDESTKNQILGISIRPRSSIYKTGMVLANSVGTIDYDYRGELKATFYHVMTDLPIYEVGDRVAQMYFSTTSPLELVYLEDGEELSTTERGAGGHGSTGK